MVDTFDVEPVNTGESFSKMRKRTRQRQFRLLLVVALTSTAYCILRGTITNIKVRMWPTSFPSRWCYRTVHIGKPHRSESALESLASPYTNASAATEPELPRSVVPKTTKTSKSERKAIEIKEVHYSGSTWTANYTYGVVRNLFSAEKAAPREDVTLVVHVNVLRLESIIRLSKNWFGPMEVGVYMHSADLLNATIATIERIRKCEYSSHRYANWHTIFPYQKPMTEVSVQSRDSGGNCVADLRQMPNQVKSKTAILVADAQAPYYPSTLISNVLRDAAKTEFVFQVDADLTPSKNLRGSFIEFAKRLNLFDPARVENSGTRVGLGVRLSTCRPYREELTAIITHKAQEPLCAKRGRDQPPPPDVYVVPTFQTSSERIPKTVAELKVEYERGASAGFYQGAFVPAYTPTQHKTWIERSDDDRIDCAYEVKYFLYYEPFFIARKTIPRHDERFFGNAFSMSNQHATLAAAGYRFKVLKNAFLIHRGWKAKDYLTPQMRREVEKALPTWWKFIRELDAEYHPRNRVGVEARNRKNSSAKT